MSTAPAAVPVQRRFFVPEVVQTSTMDCGPAALKSVLEGFGVHVSYGRLREACQTSIDGTSIDTVEVVARRLGLAAEQIIVPIDHLLLPEAAVLPAIVVVYGPNGSTHFVVVWRRVGRFVQIMDPGAGRVWMTCERLEQLVYQHDAVMEAATFSEWVRSEDFVGVLRARLRAIGAEACGALLASAVANPDWRAIARLDATVRMAAAVVRSGALRRGAEAAGFVFGADQQAASMPDPHRIIPSHFWIVREAPPSDAGAEQVEVHGGVLITFKGLASAEARAQEGPLPPELSAALAEPPVHPLKEFVRLLRADGLFTPAILGGALAIAAMGGVLEALLLRGLFDMSRELGVLQQRLGAAIALFVFIAGMLALELPITGGVQRMGRKLEARMRVAFLEKLPRLGDRYLQSRLSSDMADRSHAVHTLRTMPDLGAQVLRTLAELVVTTAGIIWLDPSGAAFALAAMAGSVALPLLAQRALAERDLRFRTHAGGLGVFYLDALLGLVPIRSHGAERAVRRAHEQLLVTWARAGLDFMRAAITVDALQSLIGFALAAALLFRHLSRADDPSGVLLLVYWALNIPTLGQNFALFARQYPAQRNTLLRLVEPLGALEEARAPIAIDPVAPPPPPQSGEASRRGVSIAFEQVTVVAGGHAILEEIDLRIPAGQKVGIVGPSGAGKSSLVGLLLGWHRAELGRVLVDGAPLGGASEERLRRACAWVDPAVQLWNRSLFDNLRYGVRDIGVDAMPKAIEAADLFSVLERLPDGLQTQLGEGGALVSGGEGQRVRLARAMLRPDARLAILDEPFRGLDRERRRVLLGRARAWWKGATILCVTHDVAETLAFERVLVVDGGRVIEDGAPQALAAQPGSRYRRMLDAEERLRRELWAGPEWRKLTLERGHLDERVPGLVEITGRNESRSVGGSR